MLSDKGQVRDVYDAVADPTRRKILQMLTDVEELPLYEITVHFQMGRTAVSKHLAILKEADLVVARKVGRETRYRLNAKPLKEIQDWVSYYESFWKERMFKLNQLLEEQNMKPDVSLDFQFTSSVEKVWHALTDSDMLAKWIWNNDFKAVVGHKFQFRAEPSEWWDGIVDCEVLNIDEPNSITYTWASAGETTTVTWTLTKNADDTVQLKLDQSGFSEETKARQGAIQGATYAWTEMGNKLGTVLA
ncbi:ArsR family transcriptional regulator [Listeria sp. SHR_NRA_18]|nr:MULTISPECIES: metalloregulator ArsR/SmtB family transcription factor [Listeria]KMT63416.1 hypothetical protein X559_0184 [Listeria newyorkensis]RQW68093.1 ArsR family transcriptional regulator [Listeria sp. SHR_NRA_18]WAO21105.1 metalloregulator ArsR/SmtB family transcription factor [Listeria newyorkensis]SQC55878.1 DNA-binding transcriptional repressor ArsR [Listeria newyorkensis]